MAKQEKRSHPRIDVDRATVSIGADSHPLRNWSERGFLAGSYQGGHQVGDEIDIVFRVPFVGIVREFAGRARVVRVDEKRQEIAGILIEMGEEWSDHPLVRYFSKDWED